VEIGKFDLVTGIAAMFPAPSAPTPEQRAEQQRMIHAIQAVNDAKLFGESSELTFTFTRHSRKPVLTIVDRETKEVIRQIPPEYLLRLAEDLGGR